MEREIPLIKEYRINDLVIRCLKCFDRFEYDRNKQRECVLKNYITLGRDIKHWDKSIFRGMVIPSLKYLGLLYGEGDSLKVSANGKIIIESNINLYERVLRAIVFELDLKIFLFLEKLSTYIYNDKNDFILKISSEIKGKSDSQKKERINKWLVILNKVGLINNLNKINIDNKIQAEKDIDHTKIDLNTFTNIFLESYKELAKDNVGIIKIEEIRKQVCIKFLRYENIVTEFQFDELLRIIPFETDKFIFSLGKPMGAQEKLFEYKNSYYNTLHIKFYS
jgi:hypothetical protein